MNTHIIPDALADALGRVVADYEREHERRLELWQARAEALLTRLEARERDIETEMAAKAETRFSDALSGFSDRFDKLLDVYDGLVAARSAAIKDGEQGPQGEQGPPGRDGADGKDGEPGRDGKDGTDGRDGLPGVPGRDGLPGERGERGEAGERGMDGESVRPLGKFDPDGSYRALDLVAWDGTWWLSKSDAPGVPGEGDGWMVLPRPRKGDKGERGEAGRPGQNGKDGAGIEDLIIDDEFNLNVIMTDGRVFQRSLLPAFRSYHEQVTR